MLEGIKAHLRHIVILESDCKVQLKAQALPKSDVQFYIIQ